MKTWLSATPVHIHYRDPHAALALILTEEGDVPQDRHVSGGPSNWTSSEVAVYRDLVDAFEHGRDHVFMNTLTGRCVILTPELE